MPPQYLLDYINDDNPHLIHLHYPILQKDIFHYTCEMGIDVLIILNLES